MCGGHGGSGRPAVELSRDQRAGSLGRSGTSYVRTRRTLTALLVCRGVIWEARLYWDGMFTVIGLRFRDMRASQSCVSNDDFVLPPLVFLSRLQQDPIWNAPDGLLIAAS
nr:uncharacterized protein LOC109182831 [Ipomoea batatas]